MELHEPREELRTGSVLPLMALLLAATTVGASELALATTPGLVAGIAVALTALLYWCFNREKLGEWMTETWWLLRMIVPVLIPAGSGMIRQTWKPCR